MPIQVCDLWQSWLEGGKAKTQTPRFVLFTLEEKELQVAILENTIEILGTQEICQQLIQAVFFWRPWETSSFHRIKSSILLSPQSWERPGVATGNVCPEHSPSPTPVCR